MFAEGLIVDILKSVSGEVLDWVRGYDFTNASRKYGEKIVDRYGWMKIMGMTSPVPLDDIYTSVNILHKIIAQWRVGLEKIEELHDKDRRGFGVIKQEKVNGLKAVSDHQYLMLLGKPGAGKTTFLKYLTLQAIQGRLTDCAGTTDKRLPVFIGLKDFSESKHDEILDFITHEFSICRFPDAKPFITRLLEQGKFLLLFDGLDEVHKGKVDVVQRQIRDFADQYSDNQFIISCRIAAYNYYFTRFTDIELADFDDDHIKLFVGKWFEKDASKAERCMDKLFLEENEPIKELGSVPLLLTLLCIAFKETADFPQNRAELYKDAIEALLRKWDATRNIQREEIYRHLSAKRKQDLFSQVAAKTYP